MLLSESIMSHTDMCFNTQSSVHDVTLKNVESFWERLNELLYIDSISFTLILVSCPMSSCHCKFLWLQTELFNHAFLTMAAVTFETMSISKFSSLELFLSGILHSNTPREPMERIGAWRNTTMHTWTMRCYFCVSTSKDMEKGLEPVLDNE